jgi:Cu/Zn superoxide dismutase
MKFSQLVVFFVSSVFTKGSGANHTAAIANINSNGFEGTITFTHKKNATEINLNFQSLPEITGESPYAWHIHVNPVDSTGNCNSTGFHLDPAGLNPNESNPNYKCDPNNAAATCEVGDLSGKFGKLHADQKFYKFLDPTLHLNGKNGIIGRSIVFHLANDTRIACANINVRPHPSKCGH